ncbi:hypothetical protein ACNF0X_10730 [Enterobacter asburiae]|uniref:hypothetical protein n=1 Tax=Enterobacter asburiae TaxID=61645 RepID=UPI003CF24607
MFHVDNNSAVPVMPAVKPVVSAVTSFFTEGGNGVPPTYPGPDWFNIIQSELLAVLAAAGITPDKASNVQLLAAMRALFLDTSQNGADIQDKALFLKNLGLGTAATKNVGTSSGQIPDMSSFVSSRSATSIVLNLPGGYKLMCGQQLAPTDAQGNVFLTLPDTFPTGFIYAEAHQSKISYAGDSDPFIFSSYPSATAPVSKASFAVRNTKSGIALVNSSIVCMYFVLGY